MTRRASPPQSDNAKARGRAILAGALAQAGQHPGGSEWWRIAPAVLARVESSGGVDADEGASLMAPLNTAPAPFCLPFVRPVPNQVIRPHQQLIGAGKLAVIIGLATLARVALRQIRGAQ